ncbi:MAG: hypothetical protein DRO18_03740 [Thermoprotei archaeon]|nr:MAG: hypothetical protein DRO18_03740 [Thermoprotei archaeon]
MDVRVMLRAGLVIKKGSSKAKEVAEEVIRCLKENNVEIYIEEDVATELSSLVCKVFSLREPNVDFLVVIGGDGTLFRALHKLGNPDIPILTVRAGRRGFILDVDPYEVSERLRDFLKGRYFIKEYFRLKVLINGFEKTPSAVNDVVLMTTGIYRTKIGRLIIMRNHYSVYNIDGDGVIVATPLGSTAYSLAAGGPVLDHDLDAIVVTPLAPIQLGIRPIVLPSNAEIHIKVRSDSPPLLLSIDGQVNVEVMPDSIVKVFKDERRFKLVRFKAGWLYERLTSRIM